MLTKDGGNNLDRLCEEGRIIA